MGLESAVGLGSTFWFEVPFTKQPASSSNAGEGLLTGVPVLAVGFPPAELEAVAPMLRGWGVSMQAVATVEAAMQRLAAAETAAPVHSVLIHADRIDAARQMAAVLRRGSGPLPPLMLCLASASGRSQPIPVPAEGRGVVRCGAPYAAAKPSAVQRACMRFRRRRTVPSRRVSSICATTCRSATRMRSSASSWPTTARPTAR